VPRSSTFSTCASCWTTRSRPRRIPSASRSPSNGARRSTAAERAGPTSGSGASSAGRSRYVHDPDARGIGTVRYPRIVPRDEACAEHLKARTLTNLYNQRPTWLDLVHRRLDEAVFAAYGWPSDVSNKEILERLLALNLDRALGGGRDE